MRNLNFILALIFCPFFLSGQDPVWHDASEFTLTGKPMPTEHPYHRIDTAAFRNYDPSATRLLKHPAGLAVAFTTDSRNVSARWSVAEVRQGHNMTPIMQKGFDLYIRDNGRWLFAGAAGPTEGSAGTKAIVQEMDGSVKECLLYLPLYSELLSLEIGIDQDANINSMPSPMRHRVVIYGSSIAQGASASRPGLAYPSRLARSTGIDLINMGISGNGKMQPGTLDVLRATRPDAVVLDCMPNPNPEEIKERLVPLVEGLREALPGVPVILVDRMKDERGNFNLRLREYSELKQATIREAVSQLDGTEGFYFIDLSAAVLPEYGYTIDGTHPTDSGFDIMLEAIGPRLLEILASHGIE